MLGEQLHYSNPVKQGRPGAHAADIALRKHLIRMHIKQYTLLVLGQGGAKHTALEPM